MPSLEDVYEKFGFAAEAAQLLETELGNKLLIAGVVEAGLLENPDPGLANDILSSINKQTLGQLLRSLKSSPDQLPELERMCMRALAERNRLFHSFYRQHNFRRNSDRGREQMIADLDSIHNALLDAYKAVVKLSGVDLDKSGLGMDPELPTQHLPI